ncbi:MAG: diaminopimelate epimerase [Flavobacteriaceae bacterium]|jgi:diaminopimelate epimerase|nr:diaminopimelate epimerase [Flavobacteriaceae bacterium]
MNFYKYQGTGNDFVMIDNRNLAFAKDKNIIEKLCNRKFGIGADGLILLENAADCDFKMVYYNADGNESTMCGNGGRCIVAFADFLNIIENQCKFTAIDGLHEAEIRNEIVKLKMSDVDKIEIIDGNFVLNTGSPHVVKYVSDVKNYRVYENGNEIRNSEKYRNGGINVNFTEAISENEIFVRTYERGVENETLSCGTGVTAAALVFMKDKNLNTLNVKTLGGNLKVYAEKTGDSFKNIWLEGEAVQVFEGNFLMR